MVRVAGIGDVPERHGVAVDSEDAASDGEGVASGADRLRLIGALPFRRKPVSGA